MLLHDSFFHATNKSINATHFGTVTMAYSPLFHSTLTFILSIFGLLFNLICCIKIWWIISQHRERKLSHSNQSSHILSEHKYRFLFVLTSNDILLCFSSIISCLDEKYFFQSFLARYHLCAAQVLIWKFALHFLPLLIIAILCRYHYILKKDFQFKSSGLSTLTQVLCTDLSILIPFVLALAWSVDGLWLWGVANVKDFLDLSSTPPNEENDFINDTTVSSSNERMHDKLYLAEQETICYFQTNHNINFTVRLVHLIQADFLLLFSLHLIGLLLEIILHIRLCCCVMIKKMVSSFNRERQLCIYILYIFMMMTSTSLPFYFYRTIEIVFDIQLTSISSQTFAQILLLGSCFKPLLFFLLFFPSSILFKLKCYLNCYSPVDIEIVAQNEEEVSMNENQTQQLTVDGGGGRKRHCYSLFNNSHPKFQSKLRAQSNPVIPPTNQRLESMRKSEDFESWLRLTSTFVEEKLKETSDIDVV